VRVERLQEITGRDAMAEGVEPLAHSDGAGGASYCGGCVDGQCSKQHLDPDGACRVFLLSYRDGLAALWDTINGERAPWASNPWVWVVEFRRLKEAGA
jgi:hypothetical protein